MSEKIYRQKYLKYKNKYLKLKKMLGGDKCIHGNIHGKCSKKKCQKK